MSKTAAWKAVPVKIADKQALRRILDEQDATTGFTVNHDLTPQTVRALMAAQGIRPEENAFTCELRRMRDGE